MGASVVVLGCGVAGYAAAKQLERAEEVDVTVIDPAEYFQFKPALYRVMEGWPPNRIGFCLESRLGSDTTWIQENVKYLNTTRQVVETEKHRISYDYVIMALGSETRSVLPNDDTVMQFETWRDADRIREHAQKDDAMAVVGAGIKGAETAFKLRHINSDLDIMLFEAGQRVTPQLREDNSERIEQELDNQTITVKKNVRVTDVSDGVLTTDRGKTYAVDTVIETTGVQPCPVVRTQFGGPLPVNQYLYAPEYERVFGAGDAIELRDGEKTNRAYYAALEGQLAARNVLRTARSEPLKSYNPPEAPYLVSFGGYRGLYQGKRISFTGILPFLMELFGVEKRFLWLYKHLPWWRHRPLLF